MGKEDDKLSAVVDCLDVEHMPLTLVSVAGFHCDVWRSMGVIVRAGQREPLDFVVKRHLGPCPPAHVHVLARDYRRLRTALAEVVPRALFVATRVDGEPGVVVLAETCTPWFDLAHPANEEEARPLLARLPKTRAQLRRFVRAARVWAEAAPARVIDLYGAQNLVLDHRREVRYLDSFGVFLYPDVLDTVDDEDDALRLRIEVSLERLVYLERLLGR